MSCSWLRYLCCAVKKETNNAILNDAFACETRYIVCDV